MEKTRKNSILRPFRRTTRERDKFGNSPMLDILFMRITNYNEKT